MVELASHHGQGPLNMQEIADRQQVSRKYLDTLFNSLKVAGLVVSRRGLGGGWELTRAPAVIQAGEILDALEGSLSLVQCVEFPDTCARVGSCVTRELYVEIDEAIRGVLVRHTLADLLQRRQVLDALADGVTSGDLCAPEAPSS
jgi:Rrf2 family protein